MIANSKNFSHNSNVLFGTTMFGRDFNAMVQRVSLPGINYPHIELSKTAVKFHTPADTPDYNPLTLDLLLDDNFVIWSEILHVLQTQTKVADGDQVMMGFESFITIFNEKDIPIIKVDFHHCFLESVSDLEYDTTSDDNTLTVSLSIAYAFYKINNYYKNKDTDIIDPLTMKLRKARVKDTTLWN